MHYPGDPKRHHQLSLKGASQVALAVKNLLANTGDLDRDLIPGSGRSLGEGHGYPLWYSCLENPHGQTCLACYSPWGRKD